MTITIATTGNPMTLQFQKLEPKLFMGTNQVLPKNRNGFYMVVDVSLELNIDKWMERLSPSQHQSTGNHFFSRDDSLYQ